MANQKTSNEELKWYQKLRVKYKLTIRRQDTYEERVAFQISRLFVFIFTGAISILLIVLTSLLIAYTPLKEYIPGQTDIQTKEKLYVLMRKTDSIERELYQKEIFLENVRRILKGEEHPQAEQEMQQDESTDYKSIELSRSKEDSLLRQRIEEEGSYVISRSRNIGYSNASRQAERLVLTNFFKPLNGFVTNAFNADIGHFGVDIVPDEEKTVKATLSGTVIFSEWTVETGNVIAIQHDNNLISVYKHNEVLLKNQGEQVLVGDPIAISGESGELSTGPHLHFELWYNTTPVDPEKYIIF